MLQKFWELNRCLKGPRLAIITNAGGPGVMATDALIAQDGKLAKLSQKTMDSLNAVLPPFWSHGNPIDVLETLNLSDTKQPSKPA